MLEISTLQAVLGISIALIIYYLLFKWNPNYFKKLGVKGPYPLPLLGNMMDMFKLGMIETDVMYVKKYGQVIGTFEGARPVLLVSDPDMVQQILVKDFHKFPNRRAITVGDPVTDNFVTALKDDHWRHVRHLLTPTFSTGKLKKMTTEINTCAQLLVQNLSTLAKDAKFIDMRERCGDFTMDVIARTAFGIETDTQKNPNSPFVVNANKLFNANFARPVLIVYFFLPFLRPLLKRYCTLSLFPPETTQFFTDVAKKAIKERLNDSSERTDFLQLMLNAHNDNEIDSASDSNLWNNSSSSKPVKRGLTENEIIAQSMLFLLGGYETTATTLSFVTYCLALNPDCQERLHEEIVRVVGDKANIDFETAGHLTYLEQCINETLRLYPVSSRTDRETIEDTVVAGIPIPKDLPVAIQVYSIHHNPQLWPDPEKFDPERFSAENKASHHPMQFLPFGLGPRMCIGMRLAMLEMKIALAHLVRTFRFLKCEETDVPLKLKKLGLLQSINGIKLKLERRMP